MAYLHTYHLFNKYFNPIRRTHFDFFCGRGVQCLFFVEKIIDKKPIDHCLEPLRGRSQTT